LFLNAVLIVGIVEVVDRLPGTFGQSTRGRRSGGATTFAVVSVSPPSPRPARPPRARLALPRAIETKLRASLEQHAPRARPPPWHRPPRRATRGSTFRAARRLRARDEGVGGRPRNPSISQAPMRPSRSAPGARGARPA
jgi:hypothetical protein